MTARTVLVDLLYFTGKRGGTETYLREVVRRLPPLLPDVEFKAVTNRVGAQRVRTFFPGEVRVVRWVGEGVVAWPIAETLWLGRHAAATGADLLWSPANMGPWGGSVPRALTLHDVIYHDLRSTGLAEVKRRVVTTLIERAARGASLVMTDSEAAAADIIRTIRIPRERLEVVLLGTSPAAPVAGAQGIVSEMGIPLDRPLVLSTGNRMPHKNFDGLLRALAHIEPSARPLLAITGSHGADPLASIVTELGLDDDVRLLGWVEREQLEALYEVAAVYACPSLAEGFGLPVVDAMTRGTAVVAHDVPVLREVGGDVATYADATDPAAFGAALEAAVNAPQSQAAGARRRARAATFTWDACAERVATLLQRALAS